MDESNYMDDATMHKAGQEVVKRGRGGNANFPGSRAGLITTNEDRQLVSKLLGEVLVEYRKPRVTSDEELAERLSDYFMRCAHHGQIPTVEEMCLCTGYSQATLWDWETGRNKGFSPATSEVIKKAKYVLKTFDAKLVTSGKLNFLAYCFRAKNYYDMHDKSEVVLTPNKPLGDEMSEKQVAEQVQALKSSVIIDDD